MNQAQQPEALRLAARLRSGYSNLRKDLEPAAAELERLYARVQELEEQKQSDPLTEQQQKALEICLARGNVNVAQVADQMGISWRASFDLCQSLADRPWLVRECAISPVLDHVEELERDHSDEDAAIAAGKVQAALQGRST